MTNELFRLNSVLLSLVILVCVFYYHSYFIDASSLEVGDDGSTTDWWNLCLSRENEREKHKLDPCISSQKSTSTREAIVVFLLF